jgi:hypothetical protein
MDTLSLEEIFIVPLSGVSALYSVQICALKLWLIVQGIPNSPETDYH